MIDVDDTVFPNNVVLKLAERYATLDADLAILRRPLRNTDPMQSVGVYAAMWNPDPESMEIIGGGRSEPTLQQYVISVQAFIRDGDEERGLAVHSVLSSLVRRVLYRDDTLRLALQGLSVETNGVTESLKRWRLLTQRYFNNDIDGQWIYLSTLELWMETEIR